MGGLTAYHSGLAAEDRVVERYERGGFILSKRRWRGKRGEIDLILERDDKIHFVEVKKSATHGRAAAGLGRRQQRRIYGAAEEYLATTSRGLETDCQFDVAVVDAQGQVRLLLNELGFH